MAEYIEREALIDWLTKPTGFKTNCEDCTSLDCLDCIVGEAIRNAPAADVVPVVRCVNCIHYGAEASAFDAWTPFCLKHKVTTFPDDFCSYGERRDGE